MLVLVVGPSGAGKDTLIDAARTALAHDDRFRFVRRVITRPPGAGEDHQAEDKAAFDLLRDAGGFALHWQAHGLHYGIPATIGADLAAGRVVIANVSRSVIANAASRFAVTVLEITAPPAVLARRLTGRGREGAADIAARLARCMTVPDGVSVATVVNDRDVEQGVAGLLAVLRRASGCF